MEIKKKILSLIEIFENPDFFFEIFKNPQFGIKFSKNLDFGPNFRKIWILIQIFENVHFWKTSILVKMWENLDI